MREIIEVGPACRERFLDQQQFPEFGDAGIWIGGLSELRDHHRIDRQFSGRAMLSFALDGSSRFMIGDTAGHLCAGEAIFIPPEVRFSLTLDEGGYRDSAWIIVEWTPAWRELAALPCHFRWPDGRRFAGALEALHAEHFTAAGSRLRMLLIEQCREYMLREARRMAGGKRRDALVDTLLVEVLNDLARPWTLDTLCRRAGLSPAQLNRRFLAQCGEPPMARISALRLQRAALLLSSCDRAIGSIAESVGYPNAFHFSTAFKARFGESPSQYRHRNSGASGH
ncbi:AraC family transcriptional regulator [Niveibacterium umoris]|uniref:AraC-like DNA-binding protein n=1 Tax=Niveibacterium umoris TaxID=1193620 RepID=A0A840BR26_9RHOO|nr:helix-turn-helix transcriptional regulator [Niveibacterium umoris]MBB4014122.1 AraC-like DNA-binding protein [Niveibacterium umoris]